MTACPTTLGRRGHAVTVAAGGEQALERIAEKRPDAVVTDLQMPGMSGLDLLAEIRKVHDDLPVVFMTAYGSVETAVEAMRQGAFDYVTKPFGGDELGIAVDRAIEHGRLKRERGPSGLRRDAGGLGHGNRHGRGRDGHDLGSRATREGRGQPWHRPDHG